MKILSRRQALGTALTGIAASTALSKAFAAACGLTPRQTEGPFYPVVDQLDKDTDLTKIPGRYDRAEGRIIFVGGQVTDEACRPVQGALVEIWQACASGRYNHPSDTNPAPVDPNFQYWGQALTDAEGRYRFKTILPGAYPADVDWDRPPHIHFKITGRALHELTTQLYFEGQPLNATDKILRALPASEQRKVVVPLVDDACVFDIAIRRVT